MLTHLKTVSVFLINITYVGYKYIDVIGMHVVHVLLTPKYNIYMQ